MPTLRNKYYTAKIKAQETANETPDTAPEAPTQQYEVLATLDNIESTLMQSEISEYYRKHNINSIQSYLAKKGVPEKNMDTAVTRVLVHLSQKRIEEFKNSIADKLQNTALFNGEFGKFWAWRIANPPEEKPLLVRTDTGIKIKYDQFASKEAIEKFLSNHISTLPDDFFDSLDNDSIEKQASDTQLPENIKTTADIDTLAEEMLSPTARKISETDPQQLAYDIEQQSNGWITSAMYEKIAHIPANKALYMLGSINAELKPSARSLLSEMRHLLDPQNPEQTFEVLIQQILDTKDDNPPSEKTLKTLSNIVNKLNKITVLSKQK